MLSEVRVYDSNMKLKRTITREELVSIANEKLRDDVKFNNNKVFDKAINTEKECVQCGKTYKTIQRIKSKFCSTNCKQKERYGRAKKCK